MPYARVLDRLDAGLPRNRVVALPDGSVDTYCRVLAGPDTTVDSRAAFAERVTASRSSSLQLDVRSREPGGQAVNAARQAHALGADVRLFGHLDDPVFDALPFETHSMGEPADVRVLTYDDGTLMLSTESTDIREWSLPTLLGVPGARDALESASAICCANWVSMPAMDGALRELAAGDVDLDGTPFVFDPGDVTGCSDDAVEELAGALSALAERCPVVTSTNDPETAALADALGVPAGPPARRLAGVRAAMGIDAAVIHEAGRAVVATDDGCRRVANIEAPRVRRETGAGDRFDGALATALAAGWPWGEALALANLSVAYYVTHAEAGTPDDLARWLRNGGETVA